MTIRYQKWFNLICMQQAARASDYTAFFNMAEDRAGYLVEYNDTQTIFTSPGMEITEQYIIGRFG